VPELVSQLSQEVYQHDLLQVLVTNFSKLEFEVRCGYFPGGPFKDGDRPRRIWRKYSTICFDVKSERDRRRSSICARAKKSSSRSSTGAAAFYSLALCDCFN
jgi:hypothetical protein